MQGLVSRLYNQTGRNVMKNFVRNGTRGGTPGENLPFDINNKTKFTINFFLYSLTGFAAPFLVLEWQMRKK